MYSWLTQTRPGLPMVLITVALMLLANSAFALRCGNKLVTEGIHVSEVLALCGQPEYEEYKTILVDEFVPYRYSGRRIHSRNADGRYVTRSYGPVTREVTITELTYNFGPNKFMRQLRFRDGYLVGIRQLGYGYR